MASCQRRERESSCYFGERRKSEQEAIPKQRSPCSWDDRKQRSGGPLQNMETWEAVTYLDLLAVSSLTLNLPIHYNLDPYNGNIR